MEGSPHKNHADHIAGKGMNSIESLQFGTQIYSYASRNENNRVHRQQWRKNEKTRENTGMAADESQKQKLSDR